MKLNRLERAVIHPDDSTHWPETHALLRLMVAAHQGVLRDPQTATEVERLHRRWPGSEHDREIALALAHVELGNDPKGEA